jgi:hypothetical protein
MPARRANDALDRIERQDAVSALSPLHEAAVERACDLDRAYLALHPDAGRYVRPLIAHEICVPGRPCAPTGGHVMVYFIGRGFRARLRVELPAAALA